MQNSHIETTKAVIRDFSYEEPSATFVNAIRHATNVFRCGHTSVLCVALILIPEGLPAPGVATRFDATLGNHDESQPEWGCGIISIILSIS